MGVLGLELYGFLFGELQNSSSIAHSAHLGGMVVGLLYSHSPFNFSWTQNFLSISVVLKRQSISLLGTIRNTQSIKKPTVKLKSKLTKSWIR